MLDARALVSVVIPNFNYAAFVAHAIESALALDWPRVEVIVVDDGSTDSSREVIGSFGPRITAVYQSNQGQAAACWEGFRRSSGEVIFFLDSDDMLDPSVVRELAPLWSPSVSKVQFQMRVVDALGRPLGNVLPQFVRPPSPDEVRSWVRRSGAYPTPPGSANAYARAFVERVQAAAIGLDRFSDSALLAAAPILGDVHTVAKPLVAYRVHGSNDGAMAAFDPGRMSREVRRAIARFDFARALAAQAGVAADANAFGRGLNLGVYRIASLRLTPQSHPIANDSRWRAIADAWRGLLVGQGLSPGARIALVLLIHAVGLLPARAAALFVRWRLVPQSRPRSLRRGLQFVGAIR